MSTQQKYHTPLALKSLSCLTPTFFSDCIINHTPFHIVCFATQTFFLFLEPNSFILTLRLLLLLFLHSGYCVTLSFHGWFFSSFISQLKTHQLRIVPFPDHFCKVVLSHRYSLFHHHVFLLLLLMDVISVLNYLYFKN